MPFQEDITHRLFNPRSLLSNLKVNIRQRGKCFFVLFQSELSQLFKLNQEARISKLSGELK